MILKQKEHLDPELKEELKQYVYDIIGYVFDVLKELPCGMPELTPNREQSSSLELPRCEGRRR